MTAKKEPIGEAPCPFAGCGCKVPVFRFTEQSDRPSMFKGRMYAVCATYGRYGADGKPASQEYLLEKATIWGAKKPDPEPAGKPENPQEKPAPAPAATNHKQSAQPAAKPAAQPEQKPAKPEGKWGLSW